MVAAPRLPLALGHGGKEGGGVRAGVVQTVQPAMVAGGALEGDQIGDMLGRSRSARLCPSCAGGWRSPWCRRRCAPLEGGVHHHRRGARRCAAPSSRSGRSARRALRRTLVSSRSSQGNGLSGSASRRALLVGEHLAHRRVRSSGHRRSAADPGAPRRGLRVEIGQIA